MPACSALSSSANARCFCCARATAALVPSCWFMGESIMSFPPRTGRLAPATIEVGRISASLSRFMRSYWIRWLRNSFVRRLASARSPSARAWLACSRRFCSSACCVSSSFDFTICWPVKSCLYSRSATFCAKAARLLYDSTVSVREAGPAAGVIAEVCPVKRALRNLTSVLSIASSTALNPPEAMSNVTIKSSNLLL